jgi:lysophospholipase L1-like esterase
MKDKEQVIRDINSRLEVIATSKGCTWLNVYPIFCDENQNLKREWTNDGLHLLAPGYLAWRDFLLPYVNE